MREYWTESQRGLIIEGSPHDLREIAARLRLPPDAVIDISVSRSVIGLWGKSIDAYREMVAPRGYPALQSRLFAAAG